MQFCYVTNTLQTLQYRSMTTRGKGKHIKRKKDKKNKEKRTNQTDPTQSSADEGEHFIFQSSNKSM